MCVHVVINMLCFPLDMSESSSAKWKQSKLDEDDAPGSLSSVIEETDLAGNSMHPASQSSKSVTNVSTECTNTNYREL